MENKALINENELVVIPDECGDTMWDDVLKEELKACDANPVSKIADVLLNKVDAVQVSDTTTAE